MTDKHEILSKTKVGLTIYAYILSIYYPDRIVLVQSGNQCKMARNPFNSDKLTLNIHYTDQMYCHQDSELDGFKGDAFDFASLHYHLKDQALLEKIEEEMQLHSAIHGQMYMMLEDEQPISNSNAGNAEFSFFNSPVTNTSPSASLTLAKVFAIIGSDKYKNKTTHLRSMTDTNEARKYKSRNFDYVTFSGVFTKRSDTSLIKHSGLLTLDFDHVKSPGELKASLRNDSVYETQLMFTSPSGNGLKWIVAIDLNQRTHLEWFNTIASYVKMKYGLEVDKSGKDISRACFLCHDPEVYINEKKVEKG